MRRKLVSLAAAGLLIMSTVAACSDDDSAGGKAAVKQRGGDGTGMVGVILPDTESSQRWGSDDPRLLEAAFKAQDVPVTIKNANGSADEFKSLADKMIADNATVLIIASLDPESGKYAIDRAHEAGVRVIDYDRLTLNGNADYYVSFNNKLVGQMQGEGLVKCLTAKGVKSPRVAYVNGSPSDNNATQFKEGYDGVLSKKFDSGAYLKGPDQSVDGWKPELAKAIFTEMWNQYQNDINGVLSANDGMAAAVIDVLRARGMNGKIPVTGQDASVEGLQNILAGDQCMTVYKPIKKEADAAAKLAIGIFKGDQVKADQQTKDVESGAYVASVLLDPIRIMKKDVKLVINDGFAKKDEVCAGTFAKYCPAAGITK
ncbi:sugar ABC transporter substrate-binding protein [Symbioplanes lichenis]|uniref:sugar ABC transporter substrate-binding protein n=1 Tax=Symbioplanes lichenis TaxID=1629072 RepID=UPI002739B58C|nr:substrate-binding domain-containing protein [Actinoplanes lichenis]